MLKKTLATLAVVFAAVALAPAAANAYVPGGNVVVSGDGTPFAPGESATVAYTDGSFVAGESVSFTISGEGSATLAAFRTVSSSSSKTASATGSVEVVVTFPETADGNYTLTATGLTSGRVATVSLHVDGASAGAGSTPGSAGSSSDGLADTGLNLSAFAVWGGLGAVALGAAMLAVLVMVRRQRAGFSA